MTLKDQISRACAGMLPGLALAVGAPATLLPAAPAAAQQWREVRCESWNFREAACPVPGAQRVELRRVMGGRCIAGETWIQDDDVVRVRGGCRAVFGFASIGGWGGGGWGAGGWNNGWSGSDIRIIRCESWNWREARCPVSGRIDGARLARVVAGNCREGDNWRWDRRAIEVRGGCRADFEVHLATRGWQGGGLGGGWGGSAPVTSRTNCESWNFQPARCAVPGLRQARIDRVLGGDCRLGQSWGFSPGLIWVNNGCRARFLIN